MGFSSFYQIGASKMLYDIFIFNGKSFLDTVKCKNVGQ